MGEKRREGKVVARKAVVFPILTVENRKIVYREMLERPDYGDPQLGRNSQNVFGGWKEADG